LIARNPQEYEENRMWHIITKLLKTSDKEKILKVAKEKGALLPTEKIKMRLLDIFLGTSAHAATPVKSWENYVNLQVKCQSKSFKNEGITDVLDKGWKRSPR
jgi:hypothetical protein